MSNTPEKKNPKTPSNKKEKNSSKKSPDHLKQKRYQNKYAQRINKKTTEPFKLYALKKQNYSNHKSEYQNQHIYSSTMSQLENTMYAK